MEKKAVDRSRARISEQRGAEIEKSGANIEGRSGVRRSERSEKIREYQ